MSLDAAAFLTVTLAPPRAAEFAALPAPIWWAPAVLKVTCAVALPCAPAAKTTDAGKVAWTSSVDSVAEPTNASSAVSSARNAVTVTVTAWPAIAVAGSSTRNADARAGTTVTVTDDVSALLSLETAVRV